jgi:hypothetical protein
MFKKTTVILLILSLVFSIFSVMGVSAAKLGDVEFTLSTDTSVQQNQITAFTELKAYFSEAEVDLEEVKAAYEQKIQADIIARNPEIDVLINAMLEGGIAESFTTDQVKQAIDKGLQWFFYEEITYLTKIEASAALKEGDKAAAKASLEKAIELYAGSIGVTAGKRDADFGTLTQDLLNNIAIPGLLKAVEDGSVSDYGVFRQIFDKTMIKVFVMATVKYAGKVEADFAAGNTSDVKKQQSEGFFFYMPIYNSMTGGSKSAADAIKDAFAYEDGSKLNAESVKSQFAETIGVKINGYVNKVFEKDLANGDVNKALEHVSEGNTFVSALEVIIKEKLGADVYAELDAAGQAYFAAVNNGEINDAKANAYTVLKKLSEINGIQFEIGANEISVKGSTKTYETTASYLDKTSNRTLASVRFIAEALGAVVDYEDETRTVVIQKDDKTIKMTVGDTSIYLNGTKSEVELDQPVVIQNQRAYIPVRAVAETLGHKVFWFDGEVVIN